MTTNDVGTWADCSDSSFIYHPVDLAPGAWSCEWCNQWQHPDYEPLRSAYYTKTEFINGRSVVVGPTFCSHNCLMNWKSENNWSAK